MKLKAFTQLFSLRDIRNAMLGFVVVFGGLGLAFATIWAQQIGEYSLCRLCGGRFAGFCFGDFCFRYSAARTKRQRGSLADESAV